MSFNSNWDIEKYRTDYESDEHWNLKSKFIKAHKTRFPEEELICLAQVFFNIEFMGCRYPAETMARVAELSKDVARDFRESRKNRLKRTFVTASDAIEAKYKANKDDAVPTFTRKQRIDFIKAKCKSEANTSMVENRKRQHGNDDEESRGMPKRLKIEPNDDPIRIFYNNHPDIILYQGTEEESPTTIIYVSMHKNKIITKFEQQHYGCMWILFDGTRMISGENKADVSKKALHELQKYFYTIKKKSKFLSRNKTIEKGDQRLVKTTKVLPTEHAKLDSSNLGFKLLQSLGWSGGGLGREKKGIEEPIETNIKVDRSGLGKLDRNGNLNRTIVKSLLLEYKMTNDLFDLVFSSEFTKEERALIHCVARECKLKSSSFGKLENRQIVISNHSTIQELFMLLRNTTDPLIYEKYEIIPPTELNS